jgi:hypothetical protein
VDAVPRQATLRSTRRGRFPRVTGMKKELKALKCKGYFKKSRAPRQEHSWDELKITH